MLFSSEVETYNIVVWIMASYDGSDTKKYISCEFKCFLLYPFTERVKIYGKNGIDLPQQIESAISENTTNFQSRGSQLLI